MPYSADLAPFASVKQASTDPCATILSQGETHEPFPQYAAIHALQLHSKPEASHSNAKHKGQYSRWRRITPFLWPADLVSCITCVACAKNFNFELFIFKKSRGRIGMNN